MNILKTMGAIGVLLFSANAFGGYAYCTAGSDLIKPIKAEVVGAKIQRPRIQIKKNLRPMVKGACEQALQMCQIERSQRINRVAYRRQGAPKRFRQRIRRFAQNPCYVQAAAVKGRKGRVIYSYDRMVGNQKFRRPSLPKRLTFARTQLALLPGESVSTKSTTLVMQKDGNLVLYKEGRPLWSSWASATNNSQRPSGLRGHVAVFQKDGNLVVYNMRHQPVFDTITYNRGVVDMRINRRGNMRLLDHRGRVSFDAKADSQLW